MRGLVISLLLLISQASQASRGSTESYCELKSVASNAYGAGALDSHRDLVSWGRAYGTDGYLPPPENEEYRMIDCGHNACCGVTLNQEIKCWGGHTDPNYKNMITGSLVPTESSFVSVSVGGQVTCAMREDGSLTCWSNIPADINGMPTGKDFVDVAATFHGACAVTKTGDIKCWGNHQNHGTGINLEGDFVRIQMGHNSGMALRKDGTVHMWGTNSHNVVSGKPADLANVKAISHTYYNPCVILKDDTVQCWGYNNAGQINIPSGTKVKQIFSNHQICYMTFDDKITCRGSGVNTNVPTDKEWNGSLNCAPRYLFVGTGICPGNKQTGDISEVSSAGECRSRCNTNFHETYFSVWDEDDAMKCKCFVDCDYRTNEEKYKTYEVLSVTVSDVLAENDIMINTCNATLVLTTGQLEDMTTERDTWQNRFQTAEEIEKERSEHATYKARQQFPDTEDQVAAGMTLGSNGNSFMEKAAYMCVGSIMGTLGMFMVTYNKKVASEESQLLLEA